jgi:hypothetical protein
MPYRSGNCWRGWTGWSDKLTFACKADHALLKPGGWRTRKLTDGTTQWLPPPHLPLPAATNTYHHPERMLPQDWDLASD